MAVLELSQNLTWRSTGLIQILCTIYDEAIIGHFNLLVNLPGQEICPRILGADLGPRVAPEASLHLPILWSRLINGLFVCLQV